MNNYLYCKLFGNLYSTIFEIKMQNEISAYKKSPKTNSSKRVRTPNHPITSGLANSRILSSGNSGRTLAMLDFVYPRCFDTLSRVQNTAVCLSPHSPFRNFEKLFLSILPSIKSRRRKKIPPCYPTR